MEEVKPTKGLKDADGVPGETEVDDLMNNPTAIEQLAESNSVIAITLLRIYDVLMCDYAEKNPSDAADLVNTHRNGKIRAELPWLNLDE